MSDRLLGYAIVILAGFSVASTGILINAARRRPRIGILTERSVIGFFLSAFLVVHGFVIANTDSGFAFFSADVARTLDRSCVVLLGLIPIYWLYLFVTDGLGSGGDE